jgi:hypothetical protein
MEKYFGKLNIHHYRQSFIEENYFCEGHSDFSFVKYLKKYLFINI